MRNSYQFPYPGPQGKSGQVPWAEQGPYQRGPSRSLMDGYPEGLFNHDKTSHKVPPSWGPEKQKEYPFRAWCRDVCLWEFRTTLDDTKRGPAVVAHLTGTAHALMMDMCEYEPLPITNGETVIDSNGVQTTYTGCQAVIRRVGRYFKEDAQG